jgi:hypothetical protein
MNNKVKEYDRGRANTIDDSAPHVLPCACLMTSCTSRVTSCTITLNQIVRGWSKQQGTKAAEGSTRRTLLDDT